MKKLAIVGYALPSRKYAPYDDLSFEIWGLCYDFYKIPRFERWFEMHDYNSVQDIQPDRYREWLLTQKEIPIYMLKKYPEIPMSISYPKKNMIERFGNYFTCSATWMMAQAIYEGFKEINIYGIHAEDGTNYEHQKPGITFFLGVMQGLGIKYYIPPESYLLRNEKLYGYNERINT